MNESPSMTILFEVGDIKVFPTIGNLISYGRKVWRDWTSNGKRKGKGNKKNSNNDEICMVTVVLTD